MFHAYLSYQWTRAAKKVSFNLHDFYVMQVDNRKEMLSVILSSLCPDQIHIRLKRYSENVKKKKNKPKFTNIYVSIYIIQCTVCTMSTIGWTRIPNRKGFENPTL